MATFLWSQKKTEWVPPLTFHFPSRELFGEPRSTSYFHLGIDIKTQGKEGWEVKSIAPGHVSRLRVSLGGYGKTIYIDHPDQTSSVYARLKKFAPKIEVHIKSIQYEKESYTLQQFPKKGEFTIAAGEDDRYSGNTGSSLRPHLHFEMRHRRSQSLSTHLLFDLPIEEDSSRGHKFKKLFLFYLQTITH